MFKYAVEVLNDRHQKNDFFKIERLRKELLKSEEIIKVDDFGAGSKVRRKQQERKVKDVVKNSSISMRYGRLIYNTIQYFQPKTILELGAAAGISTAYMASAAPAANIISLEGSEALAGLAHQNLQKLQLNVQIKTGPFAETLTPALQELQKVDFVFIDGDHRKEPLLKYYRQIVPFLQENSVVFIDDINWSEEMQQGWRELTEQPEVTLSINLFRLGILFYRKGLMKQEELVFFR